jgi:8-oxo-dGTP pyrophosphatase MutT (NUDIX family)
LRRHSPFECWQSVTGSLDTDEAPADAARRELKDALRDLQSTLQ